MKALKLILPGLVLIAGVTTWGQQAHNATDVQVRLIGDDRDVVTGNVERMIQVVNYSKRSGATTVDLQSASLLSGARGKANIAQRQDHLAIEAHFEGLEPASRFGPEYLTYVLWAITPEGSAKNLGELELNSLDGKLNVMTNLAAFGLILTAEPYFAVSQPGEVVVMDSVSRKDGIGLEQVDTKYELLPRGSYTLNLSLSKIKPIAIEPNTPLALYEARNALWIALWAGADKDAAELFDKAERSLQRAEAFHASRAAANTVLSAARESVETAEHARVAALKRRSNDRLVKTMGRRHSITTV